MSGATKLVRQVDRWGGADSMGLLVLRLAVLASVVLGVPHFPNAEAVRHWEIAHTTGTPYRDFPVEYPILELALIKAAASGSQMTARVVLAMLAFAGDIVTFLAVRARAGIEAGKRYLYIGAPLLIFVYRRSDLISVACAAGAAALTSSRRDRSAGIALAAAVLLKIWAVVLAPALIVQRRWRSFWWCTGGCVAGALAWLGLGGPGGLWQVASFRSASGWEIESTVGAVVWTLTGERRFEAGAFRAGTMTSPERWLLVGSLILVLALIWSLAARGANDVWGVTAAAAVAALLVLSPLLSPQYLAWLVPWVAMSTGRRFRLVASLPVFLTGVMVGVWYLDVWRGHPGLTEVLLLGRNLGLVSTLAYGLATLRARERLGTSSVSTA
jgi:hypothetical protein